MKAINVKQKQLLDAQGKNNDLLIKTSLSMIDGINGKLIISGYPINDFVSQNSFEEAVFLLWNHHHPMKDELALFKSEIKKFRNLSPFIEKILVNLVNKNVDLMELLQITISTLLVECHNLSPDDQKFLLVAQFPTIIAYYYRLKANKDIIKPDISLDHVENFLYMIYGITPEKRKVKALETYFVTVMEHGLNASTFTSRVIMSSNSDFISAVIGALGSLKGSIVELC